MLTISAVAEYKKINLTGISIHIIRNTTDDKAVETQFVIEAYLKGDLTKRDRILLFNSARKCEVSKLLSGKFNFQFELKE